MSTEHQNRAAGTAHTALFINNVALAGQGEAIRVVNPATEALVADFPGASTDQVDAAVASAANAFEQDRWKNPQFRKEVLLRLADLVEENRDALMDTLIQEIGTPVNLTANHIDTPVAFLRWFAQQAVIDRTRHLGFNSACTAVSTVVYRPVGVVAAITAFNYPLLIGLTKLGAALAAGCTTVLLSSPQAPLAVLQLGKLISLAGFPAGVINILAGGAQAGERLTKHPGVAKVSFTGSVDVGRRVMQQAATGLRSVVLELGGKSAAILLPGVDFTKYAYSLHARYARNAGQGCGSPTRILVEAARYQEFVDISRQVYGRLKVGDPLSEDTLLGPVINAAQRDRIEEGIRVAVQQGAQVLAGGGRPDIEKGWYVNPVLIGGLDNNATLARQEIFGPVSVVLTYRDVDEAIAIANDSPLGLKAYVFGDREQCLQIVPKLNVGTVQINGGSSLRPDAPMTGYKHSGVGSEWGEDGLREFLRPQHIDCALG